MQKFLFAIVLSYLTAAALFAQQPGKFIAVGITPLSYKGDLNASYQKWGAGFSGSYLLNHKKRLNGEFSFLWGTVWGNNPNYETQGITNKYFKSKIFSLGYSLRINVLSKENFKIFISPGLAFFRFNPKDEEGNNLTDELSSREPGEEYSNTSFALPLKAGGFYLLPNGLGIAYEFGWLNITTDYLDNISNLGTRDRNDNVLFHKISVLIPLKTQED